MSAATSGLSMAISSRKRTMSDFKVFRSFMSTCRRATSLPVRTGSRAQPDMTSRPPAHGNRQPAVCVSAADPLSIRLNVNRPPPAGTAGLSSFGWAGLSAFGRSLSALTSGTTWVLGCAVGRSAPAVGRRVDLPHRSRPAPTRRRRSKQESRQERASRHACFPSFGSTLGISKRSIGAMHAKPKRQLSRECRPAAPRHGRFRGEQNQTFAPCYQTLMSRNPVSLTCINAISTWSARLLGRRNTRNLKAMLVESMARRPARHW